MRRRVIVVALVTVAACAPSEPPPETTTTVPATTTTAPAPPPAACAIPGEFVEGGVVAEFDSPGSDARTIGPISWTVFDDGCERFTISFHSAEGAPATTPPSAKVEHLDGLGVLRISLDTTGTMTIDQLVQTGMVDRLYVVSAIGGGMFIDLHLSAPVLVRATGGESPAQMRIELLPGIVDPSTHPIRTDKVVVLSPGEGATTPGPVPISGYARGLGDGVLILATAGTDILYEEVVIPAAAGPGWAEIADLLDVNPGPVLLFIGEDQPGPSGLDGVVIALTVE